MWRIDTFEDSWQILNSLTHDAPESCLECWDTLDWEENMETVPRIHSEPDCCWEEPPEIHNCFFWQSRSWNWTRTETFDKLGFGILDSCDSKYKVKFKFLMIARIFHTEFYRIKNQIFASSYCTDSGWLWHSLTSFL